MGVRIDATRHDVGAASVDHAGSCGDLKVWTDRGDQLQLAGHGETAEAYDEAPSVREAPYERQLQAARSVVQQDPKRVAQLMRTWVGNDG